MHLLFTSCERESCIQAVFVKPRFRYGQITEIKMALRNYLSYNFFYNKTQENLQELA